MSQIKIAGFSGNITRPSRTAALVAHVTERIAAQASASISNFDVLDLGPTLGQATDLSQLEASAQVLIRQLVEADILLVASPTYKGSYTGLFKHVFDLLAPDALRGKTVILLATGGGERHSLMVEHQLRPLFGFFEAFALPTAIYASGADFDGAEPGPALSARIDQAVSEALSTLSRRHAARLAA